MLNPAFLAIPARIEGEIEVRTSHGKGWAGATTAQVAEQILANVNPDVAAGLVTDGAHSMNAADVHALLTELPATHDAAVRRQMETARAKCTDSEDFVSFSQNLLRRVVTAHGFETIAEWVGSSQRAGRVRARPDRCSSKQLKPRTAPSSWKNGRPCGSFHSSHSPVDGVGERGLAIAPPTHRRAAAALRGRRRHLGLETTAFCMSRVRLPEPVALPSPCMMLRGRPFLAFFSWLARAPRRPSRLGPCAF